MFISSDEKRTFAKRFLTPSNTAHRQYEALRSFFVDGLPGREAARSIWTSTPSPSTAKTP